MWPIFLKISWVDKNRNMLNIRMKSPIDTNLAFNLGIFQILMCQKKYIFMYLYINTSKVYPGESSSYSIRRM